MDFEVRHIDGTTVKLISSEHKCAITSATQTRKLCGNDTVTINLQSATYIDFYVGDKITIFGTTYTLNQLPTVKKESERSYTYTLVFEGLQYTLIDRVFLMPDNTQGDNLMFDLAGMLDVLDDNINRGNSGKQYEFVLDESLEETEYKNLSLIGKNCLQVLQQLCQEWDTEFVFAEEPTRIAIYIGVAGSTFAFPFTYGRGGGVYELNREKGASDICTRLFVYGGTQNLTYYRHNRLCLPSKEKNQSFVEDATAQAVYGIKEQVKNFDDIYPNRIGTITSLTGCDYNEFIDSAMADSQFGFDLNEKWANSAADCAEWLALKGLENTEANRTIYYNDVAGTATKYLMAGATAKIHFNTGALAGYECDLHSYTHSSQKFVLKPLVDENGYDFPSKTYAAFKLAVGDEYVILDINLPTAYKTQAESKLATEAASYFDTVCRPQPKYTLTIEPIALKHIVGPSTADTEIFKVGDLINVSDPTGGVESATIRIDQFVRNLLDPFDYKLTLTDEITYSQQVRTLIEVDAIKRVVEESKIYDVNRIRRGWKDAEELYNQMFDTEGHYYSEKIAPLSIDTQMLKVGARSQQLVLQNVLFQPNYNANPANLQISAGSLVHYTIAEPDIKTWTMSAYSGSNVPSTAQYVYAKCAKNGTTGTWLVTDEAIVFDSELYPNDYHFLVGSLSGVEVVDGVSQPRTFAATYGYTTINGRYITTGVIKSADGNGVIIDLDAGEIIGNIKFLSSGQAVDAEQFIGDTVDDAVSEIEIGGRNYAITAYGDKKIGYSETAYNNVTCTLVSPATAKFNGTATTNGNMFVSSVKIFGGVTLKAGKYLIWVTKENIGVRVGSGSSASYFAEAPFGSTRNNPYVLNITTEQVYWFAFTTKAGVTYTNLEVSLMIEQGTVATDWTPAPEDLPYDELVKNLTATCETASNTQTKVIVCPDLTPKMLTDSNLRIKVKFANASSNSGALNTKLVFNFKNTARGSNITPTGATSADVYVWYRNAEAEITQVPSGGVETMPYWNAGQEVEFTYKNISGNNARVQFIDEEGFDTTSALYKAFSGKTQILGGLMLTDTVICGAGNNQAGMNGLSTNNVAFWAGGSIGSAKAMNTPIVILRDGNAKFGILRIDKSGTIYMDDTVALSRLIITQDAVSNYETSSSNSVSKCPNNATQSGTETLSVGSQQVSVDSNGTYTLFQVSRYLGTTIEKKHNGMLVYITGTVTIQRTITSNNPLYSIQVKCQDRTTNILSRSFMIGEQSYSATVNIAATYWANSTNLGNVDIELVATGFTGSQSDTVYVSGLQVRWYHDVSVAKTVIAGDGLAAIINTSNFFRAIEKTVSGTKVLETTIKGNTDIPGVLWAGRIASGGGVSSTDYNCVGKSVTSQRTATGTYKLTLSGFSASPTVLATIVNTVTSSPKGCSANVQSFSSSQVVIRTFSDNTLTDFEIHVVLFGKN